MYTSKRLFLISCLLISLNVFATDNDPVLTIRNNSLDKKSIEITPNGSLFVDLQTPLPGSLEYQKSVTVHLKRDPNPTAKPSTLRLRTTGHSYCRFDVRYSASMGVTFSNITGSACEFIGSEINYIK